MTNKDNLQKELQEKVRAGVKPSHLKKLKRSQSADDIVSSSVVTPLQKSKSQLDIPVSQQPTPSEQITQLQEQVKFHAQTAQNYLQSLQSAQARITDLESYLTETKQTNQKLEDQILQLRLDKIKEFAEYYEKKQELTKELDENINEGIKEIKRLENKLLTVNKKKLELAQKLGTAESKNATLELKLLDNKEPTTFNYWPIITTIVLVSLSLWLFNQNKE